MNRVMAKYTVVLCRHGESVSNRSGFVCGWCNSPLTDKGHQQASEAGKLLKQLGFKFDIAFTSVLSRARDTLTGILKELDALDIPIEESWRLNETHFGNLTGLHKEEVNKLYGKQKLLNIRSGRYEQLPPLTPQNKYYNDIVNNPRYGDISKSILPEWECIPKNMERTIPFWEEHIVPNILDGKRALVVSHRQTLTGIAKYLENLSTEDIKDFRIPNATPLLYDLDVNMKPVGTLKVL